MASRMNWERARQRDVIRTRGGAPTRTKAQRTAARKQRRSARGATGEQTHTIKLLRKELGIATGPMPASQYEADLEIKQLRRRKFARDKNKRALIERARTAATRRQLGYLKHLAALAGEPVPDVTTRLQASAEITRLENELAVAGKR